MSEIKIELSKPYEFEGQTYTEVDLSGLSKLTARDLIEIDNVYLSSGKNPAYVGLTLDYVMFVANIVTGKPIEFFEHLPAKDAVALKSEVISFFYE